MTEVWKYQVRVNLADASARLARQSLDDPAIAPVTAILRKHGATMKSQYDAFADYVAEAERQGIEQYPLYAWTKDTIENLAKKEKYLRSFTLYVDGDEVYAKEKADPLEADLRALVGGDIVTRVAKHDTNPESNPQMPARYRK